MNEMVSHYESLVNTAFDLFTLVGTDYRYLAVNDAYCRVQKRPRDQIIGRTVAEVWGEDTFQSVLKPYFDQCFAGEEVHYQRWFEFPEVGLRCFEVNYFPHWEEGKITHAIVITRDFTERKLAEKESRLLLGLTQAINESEDFHSALGIALAKICESTGWEVGEAWVPSADGTRLESSPSFYSHLPKEHSKRLKVVLAPGEGLPGKVWVGRQPIWVDEIEADPEFSRIEGARELGLKSGLAIPVRSGEEVVAVLVFLVRNPRLEDRRFMRVIDAVAGQLVTLFQKKKAEDDLRKSEEQYRTVIETANDVIFRLSADGRITALNQAFEDATGWKRQEWLGKLFTEILHPEETAAAWERFEGILHGQNPARWEYRILKRSGDYLVGEITLAPYVEKEKLVGIIGVGRDITERKEVEQTLRKTQEDLEHRVSERTEELVKSNRALQVENAERKQAEADLQIRVEQQAAVAHLGQLALSNTDLEQLYDHAARLVSSCCDVEFCKLMELMPDGRRLFLRAGVGWKPGLVGQVTISAEEPSQAVYTLASNEPVILEDLRRETRFPGPSLLLDHGVISGISVIIRGHECRHGVFGAYTAQHRVFTHDDINFLQSVANVLAGAIDRNQSEEALRAAHDELEQRVTERTAELAQANQAVKKRERQLADAQRLAHVGSWEWDVATDAVSWSDETYRIFGLNPSRFKPSVEGYFKRVHPEDRSFTRQQIEYAVHHLQPFQFEERIVRPDGSVRVLHSHGEVMADPNGNLQRMVGYCQDITERRQAESMWRRYEAIVNTSKEYFTLIDRRFRYAAANDAYCEAHGRKREEIVGQSVREIWGRRVYEKVIRNKLQECFSGRDVHYEAWFDFKAAGSGCYEVNYYPFYHQGEVTHIIVVTRNVTERKQTEEALRQSEEHYRELYHEAFLIKENLRKLSNTMLHAQEEERKRISRELHDEVGQALTAINVNLTVLANAGSWPDPELRRKLDDTQKLLEQTMESIHRFARELRPAMLDELGLLPALRSYIKTFMNRNGIEVVLQAGVRADELDSEQKTVLYRVAQESLNNVAKHAQASRVVVDLKKVNNQLRMQIKDNGKVTPNPEPHPTGKSQRLGLLGMEERVRLVHGTFRFMPKPGRGTTVRVDIPLHPVSNNSRAHQP